MTRVYFARLFSTEMIILSNQHVCHIYRLTNDSTERIKCVLKNENLLVLDPQEYKFKK